MVERPRPPSASVNQARPTTSHHATEAKQSKQASTEHSKAPASFAGHQRMQVAEVGCINDHLCCHATRHTPSLIYPRLVLPGEASCHCRGALKFWAFIIQLGHPGTSEVVGKPGQADVVVVYR